MTAYDLIQEYIDEHGDLPPVCAEYEELSAYAQRRNLPIDMPEHDSIIAVCQMLRQAEIENMRLLGQMTLL